MDANGLMLRVPLLLVVGISPSSSGRERMAVRGTRLLVLLLLMVVIFWSFNG
jgi:hypothetical protein